MYFFCMEQNCDVKGTKREKDAARVQGKWFKGGGGK